jgi:hypothetical protein
VPSPEAVARSSTGNQRAAIERLPDGDPDLGEKHDREVRGKDAAAEAEDRGQHRSDAHRFAETPGVNRIGGREEKQDEHGHEAHGEKPDHQVRGVVEPRRRAGDRGKGYPEDLGHHPDKDESQKDYPPVAVSRKPWSFVQSSLLAAEILAARYFALTPTLILPQT